MQDLNVKTKVELAIVVVLTLVVVLLKELNVFSESISKTIGLATVTFIALVLVLNLYRGYQNIEAYSNEK